MPVGNTQDGQAAANHGAVNPHARGEHDNKQKSDSLTDG